MPDIRHEDRVAQASQSPAAVTRLAASWRRSMVKHGLDPGSPPQLRRLTAPELARHTARLDEFLAVARPQLDQLFQLVCPTGCNVLLTDAEGIVLEHRVNESDAPVFRDWGLWRGTDWSEQAEGTNGIGTCLAEGRAVTIHRDQHFLACNIGLSCSSAPVFGPDGDLMAVIDVSTVRPDLSEAISGLIGATVSEAARRVEADLFSQKFPSARLVLVPGTERANGALLAVDANDLVIGATRAARLHLKLSGDLGRSPRPLGDLLGLESHDRIEDAERAVLTRALVRASGNISAAARALGVSRATLHRKLDRS